MLRHRPVLSLFILAAALAGLVSAPPLRAAEGKEYGAPKFEAEIRKFEAMDKTNPPPAGAIVCTGSSSMRMWHPTIAKDLAPLTVIPRGFGGSTMHDLLAYADRIILPYRPRAVVLYEGDNDIGQGIAPAKIAATFGELVAKIHGALPEARIYVISIKPSIKRWAMWTKMVEANRFIAELCAKDKRLTFVDVGTPMLGGDGQPRKDLFKPDDLHMTEKGYAIWRDTMRPVLLKTEAPFEAKGGN